MHVKRLEKLLQPNPTLLAELPKPVLQGTHHSVGTLGRQSERNGERMSSKLGYFAGESEAEKIPWGTISVAWHYSTLRGLQQSPRIARFSS